MNIESSSSVSPYIAAQGSSIVAETATVQLANINTQQQGQAMINLINSVPQPTQNLGNFVNVKV
jgi:hypothetical protein